MSVESWKVIFDWSAILLVGLSIIAGSLALITGKKLSDRQSAQLEQFKIDIAKQQERAAKAEGDLLELQHATLPRNFDPRKVGEKINKFGKIRVNVWTLSDFEPNHTAKLIIAAVGSADWLVGRTGSGGGAGELSRPGVWIEVSPMAKPIVGSREGVSVNATTGVATHFIIPSEPRIPEKVRSEELSRLRAAANTLAEALNAEGVVTRLRPLTEQPSPMMTPEPDTLCIFISLKPMPGMPDDFRVSSPKPSVAANE